MNPKEYLSQYQESLRRIQSLSEHRADLQAECESLRNAKGERVRLDVAVAHLMDTEEEIAKQIDRMKERQQEISSIVQNVRKSDHRVLLTLVYIQGKSLAETSEAMNYSYRQTKRLHRCALHEVAVILGRR